MVFEDRRMGKLHDALAQHLPKTRFEPGVAVAGQERWIRLVTYHPVRIPGRR